MSRPTFVFRGGRGRVGVRASAAGVDRYVATNRFRVQELREGADAKFEQRWARRPSRLATMDGFRWFALFRRVSRDGGPLVIDNDDFNYCSFTMWDNKDSFLVWRTGDAFKEAHGGGNFFGILDMLISSTQTLKGKPKPLMYEARGTCSVPVSASDPSISGSQGGWRNVEADGKFFFSSLWFPILWHPIESDLTAYFFLSSLFSSLSLFCSGINILEPECFMATMDYRGSPNYDLIAEQFTRAKDCPGFKVATLLSPDTSDDADTLTAATIWDNQKSWEDFAASEGKIASDLPAPSPKYFEGKLMLTTEKGA